MAIVQVQVQVQAKAPKLGLRQPSQDEVAKSRGELVKVRADRSASFPVGQRNAEAPSRWPGVADQGGLAPKQHLNAVPHAEVDR